MIPKDTASLTEARPHTVVLSQRYQDKSSKLPYDTGAAPPFPEVRHPFFICC
jgi:hypothetical protein